jgi:type IV pilus assembly protein PilP
MNEMAKQSRTNRLTIPARCIVVAGLSLILALGLGGCEKQSQPGKEPVVTKQIGASTQAKSPAPGKNPPEAGQAADPVETTSPETALAQSPARMPYNPIGKVDPFQPLYQEEPEVKVEKAVDKPKVPERPRTPLEKLDLGQLKLTAIVTTGAERRALVEEASGKGYVVEVGTHIGLERGAVVEIGQDRIVIEHAAQDDFGKTENRKRELKLQKPPGD